MEDYLERLEESVQNKETSYLDKLSDKRSQENQEFQEKKVSNNFSTLAAIVSSTEQTEDVDNAYAFIQLDQKLVRSKFIVSLLCQKKISFYLTITL